MQIRNFWVDIQNSSGARVGAGPLRASVFSIGDKLSACGEFSFSVPATDPNISALSEKRVAICKYIDIHGVVQTFGGGVIDKISRAIGADNQMQIHVSGNNLARELMYRSVGALDLSGGGAGVSNAPVQIMALAPAGWSLTGGTTAGNIYAGYDGESVLNALARVGEYIGEHWRLGAGRVITWLGPASGFAASGVRAVQHINDPVSAETVTGIALITSLEEESDAAELLTRVIPRGAGNGGVMLTLAAITDAAPTGYTIGVDGSGLFSYLIRDDVEALYGRIERALDFKDIAPISNSTPDIQSAANMLLQAAAEHLRRYGQPSKFYKIGLSNVPQLLSVGTTLRVVYRTIVDGVVIYDLNATYNIIETQNQIDANGIHTTGVTVSTIDRLPQSDDEFLASTIQASRIVAAHQQLGASTDTLTWRDEMDNTHGASFRFWTGDEYTSIQRAVLRFRIQPLRSTVKSIAGASTTTVSGGGSTTVSGGGSTTSSGGGSTSGSGGGASVTSAGSPHGHAATVYNGVSGNQVYFDGTFLRSAASTGTFQTQSELPAGGHTHSISVPSHTHSTPDHSHATPNHSHSTPDHTHSLTPNITMAYGIFEESGANTLTLTDLVFTFNGGAIAGAIIDIGSGWYELDITDVLVDSVFRPSQANNQIAVTTSVAKTARIEAQLTIRGVVQAVAYG